MTEMTQLVEMASDRERVAYLAWRETAKELLECQNRLKASQEAFRVALQALADAASEVP